MRRTSQGFSPCDDFSCATHAKCYSPQVASMCLDQDLADESLHYVKGKERKAVQEAVKQALVGLGVDPIYAVPTTKRPVTPWESSHVDLMEVFNPGRFIEECRRQGLPRGPFDPENQGRRPYGAFSLQKTLWPPKCHWPKKTVKLLINT